uniref:Uncharacterized protein n=1 Tax=Anguilla anguilla TaxID=7936 RepID=A0A0E9XRS3_ANGAN
MLSFSRKAMQDSAVSSMDLDQPAKFPAMYGSTPEVTSL